MTAPAHLLELHRQAEQLLARGVPALAGLTADGFLARVEPLVDRSTSADDVLVVAGAPLAPLIGRAGAGEPRGFTTMVEADLARFAPTADVDVPAAAVYLLTDVDPGVDSRGVDPTQALAELLAAGRTPLTVEEGVAVVLAHPEWLRDRTSFEMLGSRAGDRRVTGVWLSHGVPRLGWCWAGNPHPWLGTASAGGRTALEVPAPREPGT